MKKLLYFGSLLLLIFISQNSYSLPIDLNKEAIYIHEGFSEKWLKSLPDSTDTSWTKRDGAENGRRSIRIPDLKLPGIPEHKFLSPKSNAPMHFTLVTSFNITESEINFEVPTIFLSYISNNWEIYLNGELLKKDFSLNEDGSIKRNRTKNKLVVPLSTKSLKPGTNILVYHIYADPTSITSGLYYSKPYFIDKYSVIEKFSSETISLMFLFLYFCIGLYNIFLFKHQTQYRYNLYFGIFSIVLAIYSISRSRYASLNFFDTHVLMRLEFCSLYMLLPVIMAFLDEILSQKITRITIGVAIFESILILLTLFTPTPFTIDILRVWQISSLLPILYCSIYLIGIPAIKTFRDFYKESSIGNPIIKVLQVGYKSWSQSVVGNIFLGGLILILTSLIDIIDALFIHNGVMLSKYGFFIMIIGVVLILANQYQYIHNRVENLNIDLEKKVNELNETNQALTISQQRYRVIIDGTSDFVFSLSTDGKIISTNKIMQKQLHLNDKEIVGKKFIDLITDSGEDMSVILQLVEDKVKLCSESGRPVDFNVKLKSKIDTETQDMKVRLELIKTNESDELLGKATIHQEDSLIKYFISEKQQFEIGNYLTTAEEISHRLVRNVAKYLPKEEIPVLRISLREIIINAIEHGNLNITFEEKTQAMMEDRYLTFIAERQNDELYRNRKVKIEYLLKEDQVVYKITDEGSGFDHSHISQKQEEASSELLAHGRGISMAANFFDQVIYNKKGNQVMLVKKIAAH